MSENDGVLWQPDHNSQIYLFIEFIYFCLFSLFTSPDISHQKMFPVNVMIATDIIDCLEASVILRHDHFVFLLSKVYETHYTRNMHERNTQVQYDLEYEEFIIYQMQKYVIYFFLVHNSHSMPSELRKIIKPEFQRHKYGLVDDWVQF